MPDDNAGRKALVPLNKLPALGRLLWTEFSLSSRSAPIKTRLKTRSSPFPNPSTSLKTKLATKFVEEWKKKLQFVWEMVTGPRRVKQILSNKDDWGQKQLSKKIKKALDWKADCSKSFA